MPNGRIHIRPFYNLELVQKEDMPSDEIWVFEYQREDTSLHCVRLQEGAVIDWYEGPLYPRDPTWASQEIPF